MSALMQLFREASSPGNGTWSWPRFWWPFICFALIAVYFAIAAFAASIVGPFVAIPVFFFTPVAVVMGFANVYGVLTPRHDIAPPPPPPYATHEKEPAPVDNQSTDGFHVKL